MIVEEDNLPIQKSNKSYQHFITREMTENKTEVYAKDEIFDVGYIETKDSIIVVNSLTYELIGVSPIEKNEQGRSLVDASRILYFPYEEKKFLLFNLKDKFTISSLNDKDNSFYTHSKIDLNFLNQNEEIKKVQLLNNEVIYFSNSSIA